MDDDCVEVRSCTWLYQALFLKSVLDAADIEATIPNEQMLGIQPLYGNLLGGVRVCVRGDDLARAIEVLENAVTPPGNLEGDGSK